jgi:16S rRNA processing protein RimM
VTRSSFNLVSSRPQGSGEDSSPSEPEFLAVGRVLRPHGLRGELRVEIHTDFPEGFAVRERLYLGHAELSPDTYIPYTLEGHRFHQGTVLLKFAGIDDRGHAEIFREQWVWVPVEEAVPLEEGEYYLHQMLGLRVVTEEGEELGQIAEIIETGAHPVYVVQGLQGEILVPDIEEVIVHIDLPAQQVTIQLLEGLR